MKLDDDVTRGAFAGAVVAAVVVAALAIAVFVFGPDDARPSPPPFPRVEFGTVVVVVDGVEVVSSCDGFGHRVYLAPDSDYNERGVAVADDPSCVEAGG